MSNVTMLYNESIELDCGIKIWGSPCTPEFNNWAFALKSEEASQQLYQTIPNDTNIVMTHGPPKGILDVGHLGYPEGCHTLGDPFLL